eukprot:1161342-Pelagomonas_calceolata.AAC.6
MMNLTISIISNAAHALHHTCALWCSFAQSVDDNKFPGVPELLLRYADLTRATLERLCGLRDFSHVVFKEESTSYQVWGKMAIQAALKQLVKGTNGWLQGIP